MVREGDKIEEILFGDQLLYAFTLVSTSLEWCNLIQRHMLNLCFIDQVEWIIIPNSSLPPSAMWLFNTFHKSRQSVFPHPIDAEISHVTLTKGMWTEVMWIKD